MTDEMENSRERRLRLEREKQEEKKRIKEEYLALGVESEKSLLRCHKCPIWSLCPHQNWELSRRIQFLETQYRRPPYIYHPNQSNVDELRDGLKVMEEVKEKCPLLQAAKDTKLTDMS